MFLAPYGTKKQDTGLPASTTQGDELGVPASPCTEWGLQPWGRWEDTRAVQGTGLGLGSRKSPGWLFRKVLGDSKGSGPDTGPLRACQRGP